MLDVEVGTGERVPFTLSIHARDQAIERQIEHAWIERTPRKPAKTEADPDDPSLTHALLPIAERDERVLRVVYNHDVNPRRVVTVFFDRRMRHRL